MQRISTLTKSANLFGAGKDGFKNGDIATNTPPTDFDAAWCNAIQEEIATLVEAAGLALNPASYSQVSEAIQRLIDIQSGNYVLDTGVANAYVVALDPAIAAYANGMTVRFRIVNANTGASTLNAGGGAVPLVNDVGGALLLGDAPAGGVATAVYDLALNKFMMTSLVPSQAMSQAAADARYAALNNGKTVGEIFMHLGDTAPAGSLIVPVAATSISRATYAALHAWAAALAYPWGAGDGVTTFGMPNVAADYALVQANGNVRSTTAGAVKAHTHTIPYNLQGAGAAGGGTPIVGLSANLSTNTQTPTGAAANMAAGIRVLLCVQYQ